MDLCSHRIRLFLRASGCETSMKILDRYIIRSLIPPFVGSLVVILFVLILDFILDILNLVISKGVPVYSVAKLFTYSLAGMFFLAVPMAILLSSLMAYGRLSSDNEIIAARALGISFLRIMVPGMVLAIIMSLLMICFGDRVLPEANLAARRIMRQIHRKKPLAALEPRVFIDDFPNIVLYIQNVDDRAGKIFGVQLYEKREMQPPRIIMAPEGDVRYIQEQDVIQFTLYNGEIHDIDPDEPRRYTRAHFSRQIITVGNLGTQMGEIDEQKRSEREFSIGMLIHEIRIQKTAIDSMKNEARAIVARSIDSLFFCRRYETIPRSTPQRRALLVQRKILSRLRQLKISIADIERRRRKLEVELQKKYSLPLACLMFLLVGAPVGAWARRGGIGIAVGLSFGFFLIYWAFLIGGEEIADRGLVHPIVGMWSGNIVMLAIAASMLYRVTYESRFAGFGWLAKIMQKLKERKMK